MCDRCETVAQPPRGIITHRLGTTTLTCPVGIHICAVCCLLSGPYHTALESGHNPAFMPQVQGLVVLW